MPFIDCKITEQLSDDKKEIVKTKLGQAVSLLHKSENYLMVGLCGGYDLFMAGKNYGRARTFRSVCTAMRPPPTMKI